MVEKNRTYKCTRKFLLCKQDNNISNEVGGSDASTQLFALGSMDQF